MNNQSIIRIPESVLSYMTDELVRSAVDQLLDKNADTKVPGDLQTWNDLRAYNRALLSAQQVKFEYVDFLHDLWDRIWGAARRELSDTFSLMELPRSRSDLFSGGKSVTYLPSSRALWDKEYSLDKALVASGDTVLTVGVCYGLRDLDDGLGIFASDDLGHDLFSELELNKDRWANDPEEDGWVSTLPKFVVPKAEHHEVDISLLQQAAHSMLCAYRDKYLK